MRRLILILSALLLTASHSKAQDKRWDKLTFGAEWGYIGVFQSGYHFNFFAPEGYRLDPRDNAFLYRSNAEGYLHAGYNLNDEWNISLYAGLAGVDRYDHILPISLRGTRYFKENTMGDRWFAFLDLGSGICLKNPPQEILAGKIGGGYRLSFSKDTKLDFLLALRMTYTHPEINFYGTVIPMDRVNRNNAYVSAFSIGMAITF